MHRITPRSAAFRAYGGSSRSTVNAGDDGHMMQEIFGNLMKGEARKRMEFPQNYGFSAAILPRDEQQGGGSGGGGAGAVGGGGAALGKSAEAIINYVGGNRSHPIIAAIDDRRHRPYGLKPGESFQYDDQGQGTYLKRDGTYMLSHLKASLRHIKKKDKQQRPPQQSQGGGSGSGGQQQQQDPKHEGEATSEWLMEDSKATLLIGGKKKIVVKADGIWLIGKVYLGVDSEDETPGNKVDDVGDNAAKQVFIKVG